MGSDGVRRVEGRQRAAKLTHAYRRKAHLVRHFLPLFMSPRWKLLQANGRAEVEVSLSASARVHHPKTHLGSDGAWAGQSEHFLTSTRAENQMPGKQITSAPFSLDNEASLKRFNKRTDKKRASTIILAHQHKWKYLQASFVVCFNEENHQIREFPHGNKVVEYRGP